MGEWASMTTELLWRNGFAVIPLALIVAAACRWLPCGPNTRHTLWLVVLLGFLVPALLPQVDLGWASEVEQPPALPTSSIDTAPGRIRRGPTNSESRTVAPPGHPLPDWFAASSEPGERLVSPNRSIHARRSAVEERQAGRTANQRPRLLRRTASTLGTKNEISAGVAHQSNSLDERSSRPTTLAADTDTTKSNSAAKEVSAHAVQGFWRDWVAAALAVRDAVARIPAIPVPIWTAGLLVLATWQGVRVLVFRRRLRSAVPAPPAALRLVEASAVRIGLRRTPDTFMIDARISPMLWCGRRTRLLLPVRLWRELDPTGQRAVLLHELAHLRRGDHWVRRAEGVIHALFWWHPVVWWARHRLHEEAEACCDAWVTWLMPTHRRQYAETLLKAREYVSNPHASMPALGIGITTRRTKRFARRLKMVMTESMRPKRSVGGVALAMMVALAGWFATPARSAGPDEKAKSGGGAAISAEGEAHAHARSEGESTVEHRAEARSSRRGRASVLSAGSGESRAVIRSEVDDDRGAESRFDGNAGESSTYELHVRRRHEGNHEDHSRTVVRSYRLPRGKLKALSALMVRDDVPIGVRPHDDRIDVHATADQHEVFEAFLRMIDAPHSHAHIDHQHKAHDDPHRHHESVLSDEHKIKTKVEVKLKNKDKDEECEAEENEEREIERARAHALEKRLHTHKRALEHAARARTRALRNVVRQRAQESKVESRSRRRGSETIQKQAAALHKQMDLLGEQLEALDEAAERVSKADGLDDVGKALDLQRRAFEAQVKQLEAQAREFDAQSNAFDEEFRAFEAQAETVADALEALEDLDREIPDIVEETLDSVADVLEEVVEDGAVEDAIEHSVETALQAAMRGLEHGLKALEENVDRLHDVEIEDVVEEAVEQALLEAQEAIRKALEEIRSQRRHEDHEGDRDDDDEHEDGGLSRSSWREYRGSRYGLTPNAMNWSEARAYAESIGGHLVTIDDAVEQEWLVASFGHCRPYWIGYTDGGHEGEWHWVSAGQGGGPTYTNWNEGEPNNLGPEHYAVMNWDLPGQWNDVRSPNPDAPLYHGIVEVPATVAAR